MWKSICLVMLVIGCSSSDVSERPEAIEQDPGQCTCVDGSCYYENTGDACCICPAPYQCMLSSEQKYYCGRG